MAVQVPAWPGRRVRRWSDREPLLPCPRPPGPCRWAAGWPCGIARAGGEGAGGGSRSRWPGRRARRWPDSCRCHYAPRHQDLAVGQQGGRVVVAGRWRGSRWRSRSPWPGRRARRWPGRSAIVIAPRHQDLAVGQQGGRVTVAGGGEGAGGGPGPRGRVVELGAGQIADSSIAPRHQDLAVGQQGGRVISRGRWSREPVAVQVPVAGS